MDCDDDADDEVEFDIDFVGGATASNGSKYDLDNAIKTFSVSARMRPMVCVNVIDDSSPSAENVYDASSAPS